MTTYVALLRAVNLGSHKKLAMPALRELLTGLGHADVQTYLQSGNAVFTADSAEADEVAAGIEEALARDLGLTTEVILRTAAEMDAVVEANPMEVGDPTKLSVWFLLRPPRAEWLDGVDLASFEPETMHHAAREVYLNLPNGTGRAKLPVALGRRLKVPATMRNWRTVTNLRDLANA
jgi:uncharacterized protein (DUF1697 family)